jgi:hypothetical protein
MSQSASSYHVDPDDRRAPPDEVWARRTPEQRAAVVASLPSELEATEANPPEGDAHFNATTRAREVLGGRFARIGRRVYLARELPIYYPGERMLAPDVMAVVDVETHERQRWGRAGRRRAVARRRARRDRAATSRARRLTDFSLSAARPRRQERGSSAPSALARRARTGAA